MKRVYICARLTENMEADLRQARTYAAFALDQGVAPILPQCYANLARGSPQERIAFAQKAGLSLVWMCDECWVFGEPTQDMKEIIHFCRSLNVGLRQFATDENGGIVL